MTDSNQEPEPLLPPIMPDWSKIHKTPFLNKDFGSVFDERVAYRLPGVDINVHREYISDPNTYRYEITATYYIGDIQRFISEAKEALVEAEGAAIAKALIKMGWTPPPGSKWSKEEGFE